MISLLLANLSSISVFLPIVLGIYSYYKYGSTTEFNVLLCIFLFWGIIEEISLFLALQKGHNHHWLNINCIVSTILFIMYYQLVLESKKIWFYILIGSYLLFTVVWFVFYGNLFVWAIPYIIVSHVLMVALSAYSLMQLINREQEDLFRYYEFWIHSGVLFYFTGSLLYLSIFNLLLEDLDTSFIYSLVNVHTIVNIIANLIYTIAFLCRIRTFKVKFKFSSS
jgi:hypothetical protein